MPIASVLEKVVAASKRTLLCSKEEPLIQRVQFFDWEGFPSIASQKSQLSAVGFREIGPFKTTLKSCSEFVALFFPPAHFYAMLYRPQETVEAPVEGMPIMEMCCQLDREKGVSVTNSATLETWHDAPMGTQIRIPGAGLGQLLRTLLDKVSGLDREAATSDLFQEDFIRCRRS